ncbi:uncharacterized protein C16orf96 homolog [Bombina bombina]|uniref:uncharacterized protein C16orf96 homolog n=1 Tax=Bombina bombina TaxID=8345 RepID=UPI00235ABF6E|nr:uncharacterized protein C16orf96 homolog [Bombina bombina]
MSCSVSLKELVNLAIGTPELGAVNFNALHSLLHGLLEHLQLGDVQRNLSREERDFIQPALTMGGTASGADRTSSLFHQLQDRMSKMEERLLCLDSLPSPSSLLQGSQSQNKPVQDMWQMIQLKKKVESTEDGVNKAMSAFQELLSTFNSLKLATDMIKDRLDALGDTVTKLNINELRQRLEDLAEQTERIPSLMDKLTTLNNKLSSYPDPTDLVTWPSIHDSVTSKISDHSLSSDLKQTKAKGILRSLGQLPSRHEDLDVRVRSIEDELRRLDGEISKMSIPDDLLQQLQGVRDDVDRIIRENNKSKDELNALQGALQRLNAALQQLDSKTNKLGENLADTMALQSKIDELEKKKLDRDELLLELNVKADKKTLETKVGHAQLEATVGEVNAVLDDLIKKLAAQENEWQSMLGKLLAALEAKLGRSDLDSIQRDLEELWRILKKHLNSGHPFDFDGAAGFRKKLFEKVSCISCDRPVTMATGPHLVTVRAATLVPRDRPSTAGYQDKNSGDASEEVDVEFRYSEVPRPHTSCSHHKKTTRTQNLTTVYPYGDPSQIQYKNSEVDLIGIDGLMYKGRLDKNPFHERDSSVTMTPQPPSRIVLQRARSATSTPRTKSPITRSTSAKTSRNLLHVPSATETPIILPQPSDNTELILGN